MRLFIAWSGQESRYFAESIKKWLPNVVQAVEPFLSVDLAKGSRWSEEIRAALNSSQVGIICVTPTNAVDPWIHFEAGALSSRVEKARVCPLLFGMAPADVAGPLSQFQAAPFEHDEVLRLVRVINESTAKPLSEEHLKTVFAKWWPDLESEVRRAPPIASVKHRTEREILEEILLRVRGVERSIPTPTGEAPSFKMMLERAAAKRIAKAPAEQQEDLKAYHASVIETALKITESAERRRAEESKGD